jgi:Flp pilus assembly protein TadB
MYGKWFAIAFGFGLLVLFVIGMIATAYAPIFAVAIALLVAVVVIWGMSARRTSQVGSERSAAAQERREAGQSARPSATSAPRGGEGQAGAAHRARVTDSGATGSA